MREHLTTEKFIQKAKAIHGDICNYDDVRIINSKSKVKISCKHKTYFQNPYDHLRGIIGCSLCTVRSNGKLSNKIKLIENKFRIKHGNKYQYDFTNFTNTHSYITIICDQHGHFKMDTQHHLRGQGCRTCGYESNKIGIEEFKRIGAEQHFNKYDYSKITTYIHSSVPVEIICPNHGSFFQKPNSHLRKRGCPRCKESKGEMFINNWLEKHKFTFERQKWFSDCRNQKPLEFDFYIPSLNLIIEYDGLQHFQPVNRWGGEKQFQKTLINDKIKNEYCNKKGIMLLRISYKDELESTLTKWLLIV